MKLREPTPAERKLIQDVLDTEPDEEATRVKQLLAALPPDVRLDTTFSKKWKTTLYQQVLESEGASIDVIKQIIARSPNVMHRDYSKATARDIARQMTVDFSREPTDEIKQARKERLDLATRTERDYKRNVKSAKILGSLAKTAKDPLAQKGLPEDAESRIASFLTGKQGTLPEQRSTLRETLGKGRRRRHRGSRRTRKNSRAVKQ